MRTRVIAILTALLTLGAFVAAQPARPAVRFAAYDLIIDAGTAALGAYQVRLEAASGDVKLVGVEGGDSGGAFADPPTYDPRALHAAEHGDRIILGAYSLNASPAGASVRVARIHVQVVGDVDPAWSLTLDTAADTTGKRINPTIQLVPAGDTP